MYCFLSDIRDYSRGGMMTPLILWLEVLMREIIACAVTPSLLFLTEELT
jgi:hypothetical protein